MIDKDNLHQFYIISGDRESVLEELPKFEGEVYKLEFKTFKIEDSRKVKDIQSRRSLGKQFIIISIKEITLEAQQSLLKVTEDTTSNTHIFFIIPDMEMILLTLKSRAVCIESKKSGLHDLSERFWNTTVKDRFDLVEEIESDKENVAKFLDSLEKDCPRECLSDLYDVKRKIKATGVSVKMLLEHLSLVLPFKK